MWESALAGIPHKKSRYPKAAAITGPLSSPHGAYLLQFAAQLCDSVVEEGGDDGAVCQVNAVGMIEVFEDLEVFFFTVSLNGDFFAFGGEKMLFHPEGIGFGVELCTDDLTGHADGHGGAFVGHMRTYLFGAEDFATQGLDAVDIGLDDLPVTEVCGVEGVAQACKDRIFFAFCGQVHGHDPKGGGAAFFDLAEVEKAAHHLVGMADEEDIFFGGEGIGFLVVIPDFVHHPKILAFPVAAFPIVGTARTAGGDEDVKIFRIRNFCFMSYIKDFVAEWLAKKPNAVVGQQLSDTTHPLVGRIVVQVQHRHTYIVVLAIVVDHGMNELVKKLAGASGERDK